MIIHALIHNMQWVIVGLYLPPPASLQVLNQITAKITEFSTENVILLGDFNLVPDARLDRLLARPPGAGAWADTYGLHDQSVHLPFCLSQNLLPH